MPAHHPINIFLSETPSASRAASIRCALSCIATLRRTSPAPRSDTAYRWAGCLSSVSNAKQDQVRSPPDSPVRTCVTTEGSAYSAPTNPRHGFPSIFFCRLTAQECKDFAPNGCPLLPRGRAQRGEPRSRDCHLRLIPRHDGGHQLQEYIMDPLQDDAFGHLGCSARTTATSSLARPMQNASRSSGVKDCEASQRSEGA
jgi:hypothetical protein